MINFFKKVNLYDKELFDYIEENKIEVPDCDINYFVGCFPIIENDILKRIRIIVPKQTSFKNILINIHEYVHAIRIYKYLDSKYLEELNPEIYPMLFERLYSIMNNMEDEYLLLQLNNLNSIREKEFYYKYEQAFLLQNDLLDSKIYRRLYEK